MSEPTGSIIRDEGLEYDEYGSVKVSVVVCTCNRNDSLARCLESLLAIPDSDLFEIIVVDNAQQSGSAYQVVAEYGRRVYYVHESRKGLDFARNRGVLVSRGEYVAFTDDDVVVEPDWLANLLIPFEDPDIACVTGLNRPLELETKAQRIFEKYQSLGRGEQPRTFDISWSPPYFPLGSGVIGAGCNMAYRKAALVNISLFEECLDVGTPARGGGDLYAFYRLIRAGYKIAYQPAAVAYHQHRSSMNELRRTMFDYGLGHNAYQTRCLLTDHDPAALVYPAIWFFNYHFRELAKSLTRRSAFPAELAARQLIGYLLGPAAYLISVVSVARRQRITKEAPKDGG